MRLSPAKGSWLLCPANAPSPALGEPFLRGVEREGHSALGVSAEAASEG